MKADTDADAAKLKLMRELEANGPMSIRFQPLKNRTTNGARKDGDLGEIEIPEELRHLTEAELGEGLERGMAIAETVSLLPAAFPEAVELVVEGRVWFAQPDADGIRLIELNHRLVELH